MRGNSTSASGLPAASARTRARDTGCSPGALRSRSAPASPALRRLSSTIGSRASLNGAAYPVRTVAISATGTCSRRRAMNVITPRLGRSSQCASSTSRTTGLASAVSLMSRNAAIATLNGSGSALVATPNAASSAKRCASGRRSSAWMIGKRSWCSPANASCASRLRSARCQHGGADGVRLVTHVTKHRRLSDAGFPADDERAASLMKATHEYVETLDFRVASDQLQSRLGHGPSIETASVGRRYNSSVASAVTGTAASARETGQFAFASSTAAVKTAASIPGTLPLAMR